MNEPTIQTLITEWSRAASCAPFFAWIRTGTRFEISAPHSFTHQ